MLLTKYCSTVSRLTRSAMLSSLASETWELTSAQLALQNEQTEVFGFFGTHLFIWLFQIIGNQNNHIATDTVLEDIQLCCWTANDGIFSITFSFLWSWEIKMAFDPLAQMSLAY